MIILPRQARDQYRENSKTGTVFSQLAHPIVSSVICGFGTAEEASQVTKRSFFAIYIYK